MKKQQRKQMTITHSPKHRLFGVLGLMALFGCGIVLGLCWNNGCVFGQKQQNVDAELTQEQATAQAQQMAQQLAVQVAEMEKAFQQVEDAEKDANNTADMETCEVIEQIQLEWLQPEDSDNPVDHESNIRIYERLFQYGCDENKVKYRDAIAREMIILESLTGESQGIMPVDSECERIEESLLIRLPDDYADQISEKRIERAKIYANLSERGCPEHKDMYVELAKQELAIARALEDDKFDNQEQEEVSETYKRINMQAAAEEIFETAKKLTNPAIDFVLQVEKVINE